MRCLLSLLAVVVVTTSAYARPNYSGIYRGTITYLVNEAVGMNKAREPVPFRFQIVDKQNRVILLNLNTGWRNSTNTFIKKGFINSVAGTLHNSNGALCSWSEMIQIKRIEDAKAKLIYAYSIYCEDNTYLVRSTTIRLRRKQ